MAGLHQYIYHDEGKKTYFGRLSKKYEFDIDYELIVKDPVPTPSPTPASSVKPSEDPNLEKYLEE